MVDEFMAKWGKGGTAYNKKPVADEGTKEAVKVEAKPAEPMRVKVSPATRMLTRKQQQVYYQLRDAGSPFRFAICGQLGIPPDLFRWYINAMIANGAVRRIRYGVYEVVK